ncbi:MAG TPA: twin-arginine translocation signal domain-containing protein, partial [Pirellulaceae bacterium]|nr:twin-arginine translocation signal domain-containing protein [Pirellulaceae bacterium]
MSRITRRNFLQTSSAVAGATFVISGTKASGRVIGANDRLRIGVAGLNGRGRSHMDGWLGQENVELTHLIDPDENVLNGALKKVESRTSGKYTTQGFSDVRKALEDK